MCLNDERVWSVHTLLQLEMTFGSEAMPALSVRQLLATVRRIYPHLLLIRGSDGLFTLGSTIAAGAVVRGDVEAYTVVGGVPAKI